MDLVRGGKSVLGSSVPFIDTDEDHGGKKKPIYFFHFVNLVVVLLQ